MKIAVASDHAGFALKTELHRRLLGAGQVVLDLGAANEEPVDYPDVAERLGKALLAGEAVRGILICGSGVGACVAANKLPGIRAGLCHDTYSAKQGVEHDDLNVLCLGARVVGTELAWVLAQTFLAASFSGGERHRRRLEKIARLEKDFKNQPDGSAGK
jgi:ribose 5-phosphate isomerase B